MATRNVGSQDDSAIDESFELFLQGWLQKSVSVNFLDEYMQQRERKVYTRQSNVDVVEIGTTEAILAFAMIDDPTRNLSH